MDFRLKLFREIYLKFFRWIRRLRSKDCFCNFNEFLFVNPQLNIQSIVPNKAYFRRGNEATPEAIVEAKHRSIRNDTVIEKVLLVFSLAEW